jgi:hypothetical protein
MRRNPELEEKPNHAHYPACLGRKTEIEKQSVQIFIYTALTFLALGIFSFMGVKFAVFGTLAELIFDDNDVASAIFQEIEFVCVIVLSLLGCTKRKIFDFIVMLIYSLLLIMTILFREYPLDPLLFIISIGGLSKSIFAYRMWTDYEQLMETEGYPIFSVLLAEQEQKMNNSASHFAPVSSQNTTDTDTNLGTVISKLAGGSGTAMPSIAPVSLPKSTYTQKRYFPDAPKESGILASPMKFDEK